MNSPIPPHLQWQSLPGKTSFNPLVIYGGVGLGKTHLLQAIGHHCVTQNVVRKVVYISSEKFVSDFIQSIKNKDSTQFARTYRSADILLVDDVQFFPQSESTQKAFFHTFNTLHQNRKQIVLSSDCPPNRLKGLEERLISRFSWGLATGIDRPDLETRIAILKKKSEIEGISLDDDIAGLIAAHVDTNIRELEGILTHIMAHASLRNVFLNRDLVLKILDQTTNHPTKKYPPIDLIQRVVEKNFSISDGLLISRTRKQEVAMARHVAMYLCRKLTNSSHETIGLHFGGRDHSTVVHAYKSVASRMQRGTFIRRPSPQVDPRCPGLPLLNDPFLIDLNLSPPCEYPRRNMSPKERYTYIVRLMNGYSLFLNILFTFHFPPIIL